MKQGEWVRSSKCGTNGACVEVSALGTDPDRVLLRQPDRPLLMLAFRRDELDAFAEAWLAGEFDLESR